jgi:hypothetical protein
LPKKTQRERFEDDRLEDLPDVTPQGRSGTQIMQVTSFAGDEMVLAGTRKRQGYLRKLEPQLNNHLMTWAVLIPEPDNKHDRNAVAVIASPDIHIGYLRAEDAEEVNDRLVYLGSEKKTILAVPLEVFTFKDGGMGAKVLVGPDDIPEIPAKVLERGTKKSGGGFCGAIVLLVMLVFAVAILGPTLCG